MNSEVTTSGAALGTPRYIAPEQARGDRNVDGRADIYSLGITLFHALVGEPPFLGESGIVVMSRHLYEDVPPIRTRRPNINPGLDRAVLRMTRRTKTLRHPSGRELVRDLVSIANGPAPLSGSFSSPAADRLAG
jgi:serine/threonine-protein kinase